MSFLSSDPYDLLERHGEHQELASHSPSITDVALHANLQPEKLESPLLAWRHLVLMQKSHGTCALISDRYVGKLES